MFPSFSLKILCSVSACSYWSMIRCMVSSFILSIISGCSSTYLLYSLFRFLFCSICCLSSSGCSFSHFSRYSMFSYISLLCSSNIFSSSGVNSA